MTYSVYNYCKRLAELDGRRQEPRAMLSQHLLLSSDSEDVTRHWELAQVNNTRKVGRIVAYWKALQLLKALHDYIDRLTCGSVGKEAMSEPRAVIFPSSSMGLLRRRLGYRLFCERLHPDTGVIHLLLRKARVDHIDDAVNGQGSLSYICRYNDLPTERPIDEYSG